ncbi:MULTISPECIES: response regulator [unclassified Yoonia]|uniref:response regulator n=1 Tax=unclassified Yoonia TaxID=2629118 RepID=UPI002AFFBECD|nr:MULTISPECIES: response regulator [unclassified Yoonia]
MDATDSLLVTRTPTAQRPLLGLTVLLVEDSRFASEAIRLLCLRSGARIRRADSLLTAERHLAVYRPSVTLVDLGLPDGSGLDLIRNLAHMTPRVPVIIGTSGDETARDAVIRAGADGFLAKPIDNLAAFQSAILQHLPADRQPPGPRPLPDERVEPDRIALRDDLSQVAQLLGQADTLRALPYVMQFLGGVARSGKDADLSRAVRAVEIARNRSQNPHAQVAALSHLVQQRLAAGGPL